MSTPLMDEFQYYLKHQNEFVGQYGGKVIVILGQEVIGSYDSELEAIEKTSEEHELGTFLVQRCEPGQESYTFTYHSRVAFV